MKVVLTVFYLLLSQKSERKQTQLKFVGDDHDSNKSRQVQVSDTQLGKLHANFIFKWSGVIGYADRSSCISVSRRANTIIPCRKHLEQVLKVCVISTFSPVILCLVLVSLSEKLRRTEEIQRINTEKAFLTPKGFKNSVCEREGYWQSKFINTQNKTVIVISLV